MRFKTKCRVVTINEKNLNFEQNVIFAVNHTNSRDFPVINTAIRKHCIPLAGKENLYLFDKISLWLNGCIFVDRVDKSSRKKSKTKMISTVLKGNNLVIFPEGTWNFSENLIMLPLNWGVIEVAQATKHPIIPMVLEYYKDVCYVSIGETVFYDESWDKLIAINDLRDRMATLRYEIWEKYKKASRKDINREEWEKEKLDTLNEYKKFDINFERSVILKK